MMKKLLVLCALIALAGTTEAQSVKQTGQVKITGAVKNAKYVGVECGTSATDFSGCGRTAGTAPTCSGGATDMTGLLPYTITAAGAYKLTASTDVGATTDGITFTSYISGAVEICFENGAILTGRVRLGPGRSTGGLTLKNVRATCAVTGSGNGCIYISIDGGAWTAPILLDHVEGINTGSLTTNQSFGGYMDLGPISMGANPVKVTYSTFTSGSGATSTRQGAFRLIETGTYSESPSFQGVQFDHNLFTTIANANAAQGIEVFGVQNNTIEFNGFDLSATSGMAETARGIVLDGTGGSGNQSNGNRIFSNAFKLGDNRGVRTRGANVEVAYNVFGDCVNTSAGCVHVGDKDTNDDTNNVFIHHNTLNVKNSGVGMWFRAVIGNGSTGVKVEDNTATCSTCTGGRFLLLRDPSAIGGATDTKVCAKNNTVDSNIGTASNCTGSTAANNCADTGSHANISSSGTTAGLGTISTCP